MTRDIRKTTALPADVAQLVQRVDSAATTASAAKLTLAAPHQETLRAITRSRTPSATKSSPNASTALITGGNAATRTAAAASIAKELGVDLYRVDLTQVASKYIGETEKNLSRVFEAAERAGAVLLFDEADALFGKRTDVKDSHDRYANLEVSYLLDRVESYSGIAILATNNKSNLDEAFKRRVRFIVDLPVV